MNHRRLERIATKVRNNVRWGRTHGWANLLEEHDLDPRVRIPRATRSARWLVENRPPAGRSRAVFLVGVQRSGTNMLAHGLDQAPEVEVFNEGNRRAFETFQLRDLGTVDDLIMRCRRPFVLFKPLCDADRTIELLDRDRTGPPARAIWAFRDVDGRVRSHVLKFGGSNLESFHALVNGVEPTSPWQLRGLSDESIDLIRGLDVRSMTAQTASALFWYVRNMQYYELGLDRRPDVQLADYGAFLADPATAMHHMCSFLGFPYRPDLVAHIQPQTRTPKIPVVIDERVRSLCAGLERRLRNSYAAQADQSVPDDDT